MPEAISVGTGGPALSGLVAVSCLPACLVPAGWFLVLRDFGRVCPGFPSGRLSGVACTFVSAA